ncbi:MAG: SLBB domain-containing protein [bacterium]
MKHIVITKLFLMLLIVGGVCIVGSARAQLTAPTSSSPSMSVPQLSSPATEKSGPQISAEAMVFDSPVDPHEYRLGPGDVLQYRSWTSNDAQQIMVSADQLLVIPRVGEFSVKGKSLAQIKEEIMAHAVPMFRKLRMTYDSAQGLFSLSLVQPKRIYVQVLGEVETQGVYPFTGGTRVVTAIQVANRPVQHATILGDEAFEKEQEKRKREQSRLRPYFGSGSEKTSSLRNIIVTHSDGTTQRVDIARYNGSHDGRFCPLLREGDVVYVPFKKLGTGQIGVYGGVVSPQDFEYVEGDSLMGMIAAAMGPTQTANLHHVELIRMAGGGESYTSQIFDYSAIKSGAAPDVKLESGDRIFIRDNPDLRELSRVAIKGEVLHPGVYPIQRNVTKLSEVVKYAGGFSSHAFLAGGTVTRQRVDLDNRDNTSDEEAKRISRVSNLAVEDTANFRRLTEVREGYVSVDMKQLFEKNDASADIPLNDGDVISIPSRPTTVYVWGYVGSVGYIPFKDGASLDFYINAAGGYAEGAVKKNTRIIKVRTHRWVRAEETVIEPGDEVYVPQDKLYPDDYNLRVTSTEVSIIATVVSAVLAVLSLYFLTKK